MKVSIVIRTYNEGKHIGSLLKAIAGQEWNPEDREIVVVDSGSTDGTLQIARCFPVKIVHIPKEDFSFGRSLNKGCAATTGDALVFVSGHCIPVAGSWLKDLVAPLGKNGVVYSYGGQIGNGESYFSECQIFAKYFPADSKIPQEGYFCNNANSALLKPVWMSNPFSEELAGLEDMHLAKKLVGLGHKIGYVANAAVYHIHDESWAQVKRRFEREAIALQDIMPEVHLSFLDFLHYWFSAVSLDLHAAAKTRVMLGKAGEIALYRLMQYWGAYRGNHFHRKMSKRRKEAYYYPR
ncbi:MAG TPA: glycosyltransferase family A protein [Burkholderiales bacterium]|nr:glycosyltransferase family A protein [Burkholderiales bacterium]